MVESWPGIHETAGSILSMNKYKFRSVLECCSYLKDSTLAVLIVFTLCLLRLDF